MTNTAQRLSSLAFAALISACAGSRGANGTAPTNSSGSATASADSDASSASTDASASATRASSAANAMITAVLSAARREGSAAQNPRILFGPIAVEDPTEPGRRAVAVVDNGDPVLVYTAVPFVAEQVATGSLTLIEASKITGLAVRRINADQRPDFAVFSSEEPVVADYVAIGVTARLFALDTRTARALAPLVRAELELAGVRNEAELDAQIPTLGRFEVPTASTTPARFLARLRYATAEQFVSVTAAAGVRLCIDEPDRRGVRHKRCRTLARSRIAAEYTARYNIQRVLTAFTEMEGNNHDGLTTPSCQPEPQLLQCGANEGGPVGVNWQLVTENNVLRIAEVSPWHEDS